MSGKKKPTTIPARAMPKTSICLLLDTDTLALVDKRIERIRRALGINVSRQVVIRGLIQEALGSSKGAAT